MQSETVTKSRRHQGMWTQTIYDANATDDNRAGSPVENHSFTARNTNAEKISRTSSYEDKVEMQDITRRYKVVHYADKKTWSGTQTSSRRLELEHVMSQATQDLNDGKTRHESRELQAHEHGHPHERERCSGRNTRTPVQRETTRKLDSQTSRAEDVSWIMLVWTTSTWQVHMTVHDHDHDTMTTYRIWSRVKVKTYLEDLQLIRIQAHGWEVLCSTTEPSNCQQQRKTFSLIRSFVLARLLSTHDQQRLGKTKLSDLRSFRNIMNDIAWMANQLCSVGNIPGYTTLQLLREMQGAISLNSSKIESSSCRCTVTLIGKRRKHISCDEICKCCCVCQKFSKSTVFIPNQTIHGTMLLIWWCLVSERADILYSGEQLRFFRGALRSKGGGRSSIHYNVDPATVEFFFFVLHFSVNQFSVNRAVADWFEEIAQLISVHSSSCMNQNLKLHKVLCESLWSHVRSMSQSEEARCSKTKNSKTFQNTFECFNRKVSLWQCFVSIHDVFRDTKGSKPKGWIRGNTKIGPVWAVKVTNYYLERNESEDKMDSMQNDGPQSWIVISRGFNQDVTELPEENENPFTTNKRHLVRWNPLRQNKRNNAYHLHLRRRSCRSFSGNWTIFLPMEMLTKSFSRSRSRWPDYFDIKAILEKMMEQLNGEGDYLRFVVITLMHQYRRIKCGWNICREEVSRKDLSIAWTLTVIFSSCACHPRQFGMGTKLILHKK